MWIVLAVWAQQVEVTSDGAGSHSDDSVKFHPDTTMKGLTLVLLVVRNLNMIIHHLILISEW